MKDGESINDMFKRMHILFKGIKALGQRFWKAQINQKLLD